MYKYLKTLKNYDNCKKRKVLKGEKEMQIFVGACKECFEKELDLDIAFNIKRAGLRHDRAYSRH